MNWLLDTLKQKGITKKHLVIALLFIVGIALYANSFQNQMFWDDDDGILNNTYIKDWSNFPKFFSENLIAGSGLVSNYWRPMLLTIFSIEWHLWGDNPVGYHLVNTLLHIAASAFVFLVIRKLFKKDWLAILVSLIFLIHPLQTEAVVYVSGLADPLSVLFTLLGTWFLLKFKDSGKQITDSGYYILAIAMYVACLLTKDSAFVAVGVMGLSYYFYSNSQLTFKARIIETIKVLWPFLIIVGVYALLRATALNFQNTFNLYNEENEFTSNFSVRFLTFLKVLGVYLGLLFWPNNLHMERSTSLATSFFEPQVLVGAVILILILYFAFVRHNRYPLISFGLLWFIGTLFPHSNLLVPTAGLLYEHWLYLPMIGLFISVLSFGSELYAFIREHERYRKLAIYVFAVVFLAWVGMLSYKTIARNREWKDPVTFYNQTLQYNSTYRVLNNLGMAYAQEGNHNLAKITYYRAIALDPQVSVAYHNLANSYKETGETDLAIKNYNKAIEIQPEFFFSYNALADLYIKQQKYADARATLERLVPNTASPASVYYLLYQIAVEEKNYTKAIEYLQQVKNLVPDNPEIDREILRLKSLSTS